MVFKPSSQSPPVIRNENKATDSVKDALKDGNGNPRLSEIISTHRSDRTSLNPTQRGCATRDINTFGWSVSADRTGDSDDRRRHQEQHHHLVKRTRREKRLRQNSSRQILPSSFFLCENKSKTKRDLVPMLTQPKITPYRRFSRSAGRKGGFRGIQG